MGFRVVIVKSRAKLEQQLGYLVIRGDEQSKIHLSEINTLIIQSTAVSITCALLSELIKQNIKVILCDEKCMPQSELMPYYGNYDTVKRVKEQISWKPEIKEKVWAEIVKEKIGEQSRHLRDCGFNVQANLLDEYRKNVEPNDKTNREGHAAKVYFNVIFGEGFSRQNECFVNKCLNYGYSIILSAFSRELVCAGYLTQIGIWHDNEFNEFNLSCDCMESFRIVVDRKVKSLLPNSEKFKSELADLLNLNVQINGKKTTLDLAVRTCARSILDALATGQTESIRFLEKYDI